MLNLFKNIVIFYKMTRAINLEKKIVYKKLATGAYLRKKLLVEYYKILS